MTTYPSRWSFRPQLQTSATVSIGRGAERHRLIIGIGPSSRPQDEGKLFAYAGQTYCGSQRAVSGWHSLSLDGEVTCQRCLKQWRPEDDVPLSEVVEVRGRMLTVKPDVEIGPYEEVTR